jgi:hypothetical protein
MHPSPIHSEYCIHLMSGNVCVHAFTADAFKGETLILGCMVMNIHDQNKSNHDLKTGTFRQKKRRESSLQPAVLPPQGKRFKLRSQMSADLFSMAKHLEAFFPRLESKDGSRGRQNHRDSR